jgi:hypothetical protein
MGNLKVIALGASIALNAFFVKQELSKTQELYTLNDIYYVKGDTLSSEHKGVIHIGEGLQDTLTELTLIDQSPSAVFSTLDYYARQGYLNITQYNDGYIEIQYAGPNWGKDPQNDIKLIVEGFTDVYRDSTKTRYYMQVD